MFHNYNCIFLFCLTCFLFIEKQIRLLEMVAPCKLLRKNVRCEPIVMLFFFESCSTAYHNCICTKFFHQQLHLFKKTKFSFQTAFYYLKLPLARNQTAAQSCVFELNFYTSIKCIQENVQRRCFIVFLLTLIKFLPIPVRKSLFKSNNKDTGN